MGKAYIIASYESDTYHQGATAYDAVQQLKAAGYDVINPPALELSQTSFSEDMRKRVHNLLGADLICYVGKAWAEDRKCLIEAHVATLLNLKKLYFNGQVIL